MKKLFTLYGLMTSGAVFAHPGHLADNQIHGVLHSEHIFMLLGFIAILYAIKLIRDK